MSYLGQALSFVTQILFGFAVFVCLMRLMFESTGADRHNPFTAFLHTVTDPIVRPLRIILPRLGRVDSALVLLALTFGVAKLVIQNAIRGLPITLGPLMIVAIADILGLMIYIFIAAIIFGVVLSWVNPHVGNRHPLSFSLSALTEPLLGPARRLIPAVGGLDLSPIAVLVLLQVALILIVRPLEDLGYRLMLVVS